MLPDWAKIGGFRSSTNYHRYYDPSFGRYLRADPIGLMGGVNLYAYVDNTPINSVDPLGLIDDLGEHPEYPGTPQGCKQLCEDNDQDYYDYLPYPFPWSSEGKCFCKKKCDDELCKKIAKEIDVLINRNKHLFGGKGKHGLKFRFGEQISGAHGPGTKEWDTHHQRIVEQQAELKKRLRDWESNNCSSSKYALPPGAYTWATRTPPQPGAWRGPN